MDIDLLENDEFEVECEVRGLNGPPLVRYNNLKEQIANEQSTPVIVPNRAHVLARKHPRREIKICSYKLNDFYCWLKDHKSEASIDVLKKIHSRLLHVHARLTRISKSKVSQDDALSLLEMCDTLINPIQQHVINENMSLDDMNETINSLNFQTNDEGSESDDSNDRVSKVLDKIANSETYPLKNSQIDDSNEPKAVSSQNVEETLEAGSSSSTSILSPSNAYRHTNDYHSSRGHDELMNLVEAINSKLNTHIQSTLNKLDSSIKPALKQKQGYSNNTHSRHVHFDPPIPPPSSVISPPQISPDHLANPSAHNHSIDFHRSEESRSLSKWNIRFGGRSDERGNERSVDRFLFQVEFLANAYHVSAARLVKELSVLLRGEPYEWYWNYIQRNNIVTWQQLKAELIKMFRDRRTDDDVRRDLEARKQRYDRHESFLQFYNEMLSKTLKFRTPFPDADLLRILKQNMRPGLQIALAGENIMSIDCLIQRCMTLEDIWTRLNCNPENNCNPNRRYVNEIFNPHIPPPVQSQSDNSNSNYFVHDYPNNYNSVPTPNYDCPDFSLQNQINQELLAPPPINNFRYNPEVCSINPFVKNDNYSRREFSNQPNQSNDNDVCFNCFEKGHWSRDCNLPCQRKFCNGCHHSKSFKANCSRCQSRSENSNAERNHQRKFPLRDNMNPTQHPSTSCPDVLRPPKF